MKPVNTRVNESRDLAMMRHPEWWIARGGLLLPLEHRTRPDPDMPGMRLLGFMFEDRTTHQAKPRVYVGCMYLLDGTNLNQFPVEDFADLEAVVAAGWEVN